MLLHIPNILTADEVRHAQNLLTSAPWGDGRPGAGVQAAQVKNNEQLPHDCDAAREIRAMVLRGLDASPCILFSRPAEKGVPAASEPLRRRQQLLRQPY